MKSYNSSDSHARNARWTPAAVITSITSAAALTFFATLSAPWAASAAEAPVGLGTAEAYSVLGGQTVTNTGPTLLAGNLGVSPGTAVTGFPPGVALGATNAGNAEALQAQADLGIAYDNAASRALTQEVAGDLVGQTLPTGVYKSTDTLALSGTLTLDAAGDPSAVFIFQVASGLTTASASSVELIGGAQACNVYWQVGSSATLGTNWSFKGTVLALTSVQVTTGAVVEGRALARNGAVTLDNNVFTAPSCETTLPTPVPVPSDEPTVPAPVPSDEPTVPAPSDGGSAVPLQDNSDVITPSSDSSVEVMRENLQSSTGTNRGMNVQTAAAQQTADGGRTTVVALGALSCVLMATSGAFRIRRNTK